MKQASQGYQPWGRQGAGAPLRDGGGHVITNLRKKNGIMDYGEIQRGNSSSGSSGSSSSSSSRQSRRSSRNGRGINSNGRKSPRENPTSYIHLSERQRRRRTSSSPRQNSPRQNSPRDWDHTPSQPPPPPSPNEALYQKSSNRSPRESTKTVASTKHKISERKELIQLRTENNELRTENNALKDEVYSHQGNIEELEKILRRYKNKYGSL